LCGVVAVAESSFGGDGFAISSTIEGIEFHRNRDGFTTIDALEPVLGICTPGQEKKQETQEQRSLSLCVVLLHTY
jgi:hypothetical protein